MASSSGLTRLSQYGPHIKRLFGQLYLATVVILVAVLAWQVDWPAVQSAMGDLTPTVLLVAALFSVASHITYSAFDLIGRRYTGHSLSTGQVMGITFVSYVATLNLGALIGAVGLRQRLYAHHGLTLSTIAKVFAVSIVTNWLGYLVLLGIVFAGPAYAQLARATTSGLQSASDLSTSASAFGLLALLSVLAYVVLSFVRAGTPLQWRSVSLRLPNARLALCQTALSSASWLINAAIIYVLLGGKVPFEWVLLASLAAAFIGLITHIPAGIGVLEATFIFVLGGLLPVETLLAALIAYRVLFYLMPIPLAALLWWQLERTKATHT